MRVHVPALELTTAGARPFLKWAGGKSRLVPAIGRHLPSRIKTYYEPFLGSGAVFFALANEGRFERAALSDQNRELVDVYRALKKDVEGVISLLATYRYDEGLYYELRAVDPASLSLTERAARTVFLNKTGYNGLYRVNRSGQFNVPFGRHKKPNICDEARLRAASRVLKRVKLGVADFEVACANAEPGDAVYFDPPYVPVSKTSNFTAYSAYDFGEQAHARLAECFGSLARRKVRAVLSNSDTPLTRQLYSGWQTEKLSVRRSINSVADKRGGVSELLVHNERK